MPPVSQAQRKAMHAAASGNSTIGIPKSVGKDFSDADKGGKLPMKAKKKYDRSSHYPGNPGFPSSSEAGGSPPKAAYAAHESREKEIMGAGYEAHEKAEAASYRGGTPHSFAPTPSNASGFGHTDSQRCGALRKSGVAGAHQIGCRKK